jgi:hypothetical protein
MNTVTLPIRMGVNLGFIEKIILTDGTVLDNMHVLYRSPTPDEQKIGMLLCAANEISRQIIGVANGEWSDYPEVMKRTRVFQK